MNAEQKALIEGAQFTANTVLNRFYETRLEDDLEAAFEEFESKQARAFRRAQRFNGGDRNEFMAAYSFLVGTYLAHLMLIADPEGNDRIELQLLPRNDEKHRRDDRSMRGD